MTTLCDLTLGDDLFASSHVRVCPRAATIPDPAEVDAKLRFAVASAPGMGKGERELWSLLVPQMGRWLPRRRAAELLAAFNAA